MRQLFLQVLSAVLMTSIAVIARWLNERLLSTAAQPHRQAPPPAPYPSGYNVPYASPSYR